MVFAEPVQNNRTQSYFYMNATADGQSEMKPQPASIVLLWDISASAAKRNIAKEIALIEAYISALKNVSIDVIPFNIVPQPKETFTITNSDASALVKRLKAFILMEAHNWVLLI